MNDTPAENLSEVATAVAGIETSIASQGPNMSQMSESVTTQVTYFSGSSTFTLGRFYRGRRVDIVSSDTV